MKVQNKVYRCIECGCVFLILKEDNVEVVESGSCPACGMCNGSLEEL